MNIQAAFTFKLNHKILPKTVGVGRFDAVHPSLVAATANGKVPDGVNCIVMGVLGGIDSQLAICGGNCAIQGFDCQGSDLFWTVTGDNVSALCFCDFDGDGKAELVVGSEDYDIRVFKQDEIIAEMTETEAITSLFPLGANRFAYALANGTLGVYEGTNRVWRIKSKHHVMDIHLYDIDGDEEQEMAVGWSNGKLDFRSPDNGEVILKEQFNSTIAGLVHADYRMDTNIELICCATDGEVKGYLPPTKGGGIVQNDPSQEILHDLGMRKQHLLMELANYQENRRLAESNLPPAGLDRESLGIIPANTQLQTTLYVNPGSETEQPCVELYVATSNNTLIRAVMVFAEGIFQGESHVVHPLLNQVSNSCKVQLRPDKDLAVDLHVKALVGSRQSQQYHVFELSRTLPKFVMYALCNDKAPQPNSYVQFTVSDRPQRTFIRCEDMELCGDVIQALAEYLGLMDLTSVAEFPIEVDRLMSLVEKVNEIYMVRDQMSADVADHSNLIKGLLVRAEDARIMKDMPNMKRYYTQLYNLNQELITQYKVRCNNHEELLSCLKQVNQIIQKAGRLRVGKPKTDVVNGCRQAIKNGTTSTLPKIIRVGTP